MNGCWKERWFEALTDFWGYTNHQDEIKNILMLPFEVPGGGFTDLEEADIREVLSPRPTDLTEENHECH